MASFEKVAKQLSGKLRAYLERMVGNPTEAEDLDRSVQGEIRMKNGGGRVAVGWHLGRKFGKLEIGRESPGLIQVSAPSVSAAASVPSS